MRPLLKESFMFKVSKNAKISFFVKSKNLAVVRVTNELRLMPELICLDPSLSQYFY